MKRPARMNDITAIQIALKLYHSALHSYIIQQKFKCLVNTYFRKNKILNDQLHKVM